jgi:2-methylcitrate dehydratase PrpD
MMNPAGHVTASLARFVAGAGAASFPSHARAMAVDAITDGIGCMIAGAAEPLVQPLLSIVRAMPAGEAGLVGLGLRATPSDAALFNGTLAHALDYDDTNHPGYAHVAAVVLPAMLALAGTAPVWGRDLVTGYIVGLEVIGKLGAALNMDHYSRGWHATSTFGSLAATAAACCALGLDEEATAVALAIGASSACGIRANFGTMTKPLHAGFAARNGVAAALLAQAGWTANPTAIEHPAGYIAAFNAGGAVQAEPLLRWGEDLEILSEFGLQLKPYPACGATHPGTEAALLAHEQIGPEGWRMIEDVRMGVSEYAFKPLIYKRPETGLQGKFSLHHCVASALVRGRVDLSNFTDECVADPRIAELTGRVRVEADDRVRHDPEYATHLEIRLKDGRRVETFVPLALGKPSRWLSKAVLRAKFEDCVRHSGAKDAEAVTSALFEAAQGIDTDVPASVLDEMACAARQECDLAVPA